MGFRCYGAMKSGHSFSRGKLKTSSSVWNTEPNSEIAEVVC